MCRRGRPKANTVDFLPTTHYTFWSLMCRTAVPHCSPCRWCLVEIYFHRKLAAKDSVQHVKQSQLYRSDPMRWNGLSFTKSFIIRHACPFSLFDDKHTRHTLSVASEPDKLQVDKLNSKAVSWVAAGSAGLHSPYTPLYLGQYPHQYDIGHINMCKIDVSIRIATNSRCFRRSIDMNCGIANVMTNIACVYWTINIFCLGCIVRTMHVSFVSTSFNQYSNTILVAQYFKRKTCQYILLKQYVQY